MWGGADRLDELPSEATAMIASAVEPDADAFTKAVADLKAEAPEAAIVYAEGVGPDVGAGAHAKPKGSKWNAVRHGCMAKVLLPADLEAEVVKHTAMLTEYHHPTSDYEAKIIATMGRVSAQLERNQQMKIVDLQRTMDRAVLCWDEDRGIYVRELISKLGTVPGVAKALAETSQGAAWLHLTWASLGTVLENTGTWDEEQRTLAFNLLDTRHELRKGKLTILAQDDTEALTRLVEEQIGWIEDKLQRYLFAVDDADRAMAAAGMPMEENAGTKRLRKQEGRLKTEYRRAKAELLESRAQAAAAAAGPAPAAPESPAPVVSATRPDPAQKPAPTPRPTISNAAWNYLLRRQDIEALEIPETANSPAQRVAVRLPFPGGDPEPEPVAEDEREPESEPEVEPEAEAEVEVEVVLAEPAPVRPRTASVASHASRAAVANQRRDRDRKARRNQEKKARKAARRKGR